MMCQCGCDVKVDHAHFKRVADEYVDSIQYYIDSGNIGELRRALRVYDSVLKLSGLLDYIDYFSKTDESDE
jgi:hypothetical protein